MNVLRLSHEDRLRFWDKVLVGDECWPWTGAKGLDGYGRFSLGGRAGNARLAHRIAYEDRVGPIPDGLTLDHLCRNRGCVSPRHLEPVTRGENVRRGESGKHWADKTHCPQGHPYDEANTRINHRGARECRTCIRASRARTRFARRLAKQTLTPERPPNG